MQEIETEGLVIRETETGEADQILTLLTADYGKVVVSAKGVRSIRSKHYAAAQLYTYSTFQLRKTHKYYYIADTSYIENFMEIRYDINKLALANYICDIANDMSLEDEPDSELLQLTLNTLYAIAKRGDIPLSRIKAAYEFRVMCHGGFRPELEKCGICGEVLTENSYMDVMNGRVLCKRCQEKYVQSPHYMMDDSTAKIHIRLTPAVLYALRYIETSAPKRFLSFQLEENDNTLLGIAAERYLLNHLERNFDSLAYYKGLLEQI